MKDSGYKSNTNSNNSSKYNRFITTQRGKYQSAIATRSVGGCYCYCWCGCCYLVSFKSVCSPVPNCQHCCLPLFLFS